MRALVTGASGFLGGVLTRALLARGDQVLALVRPGSDVAALGLGPDDVVAWSGQVRAISDALARHDTPDVIFNCAGLVATEHSPDTIDAMLTANVDLAVGLFDYAARAKEPPVIVNVGTYLEYDSAGQIAPTSLYAATKVATEAMLAYYTNHHGLRSATIKPSIIYGAREKRPRLMRLLVQAALTGQQLSLSPGAQTLDLVHVDDVTRCLLQTADMLLAQSAPGHASYFALGGTALTVKDLVAAVARVTQRPIAVTWGGQPYKASEVMHPYLEGRSLPGWAPQIGLDAGIRELMQAQPNSFSNKEA